MYSASPWGDTPRQTPTSAPRFCCICREHNEPSLSPTGNPFPHSAVGPCRGLYKWTPRVLPNRPGCRGRAGRRKRHKQLAGLPPTGTPQAGQAQIPEGALERAGRDADLVHAPQPALARGSPIADVLVGLPDQREHLGGQARGAPGRIAGHQAGDSRLVSPPDGLAVQAESPAGGLDPVGQRIVDHHQALLDPEAVPGWDRVEDHRELPFWAGSWP